VKTFSDNAGRTWELVVDPFDVKRIEARLKYNLLDVRLQDEQLAAWLQNPVRIVDTLWLLCEEQAREREVSEENFGRALRGQLFDASRALLEELTDFFPLQSQREELTARLALQLTGMELERKTQTWVAEKLREAIAAATPSGTVSSWPESPASAPAG